MIKTGWIVTLVTLMTILMISRGVASISGMPRSTPFQELRLETIGPDNIQRLVLLSKTLENDRYFQRGTWSPDGKSYVVSTYLNGTDGVWRYDARHLELPPARIPNLPAHGLTFHPNGNLVALSVGCVIQIWNLEWGHQSAQYSFPEDTNHSEGCPLFGMGYSPDGSRFAAVSLFGLRVWTVATGAAYASFEPDEMGMSHCCFFGGGLVFSPDGDQLAFADPFEERFFVWNLNPADLPVVINGEGYAGEVRELAFNPADSRLVATANANAYWVPLWNIDTGQVETSLQGHEMNDGGLVDIAFSPDGRLLVASTIDNILEFWDVEAAISIRMIADRPYNARSSNICCGLSFNPDGTILAAKSSVGIHYWGVPAR